MKVVLLVAIIVTSIPFQPGFSLTAKAAPNQQINYQGKLTDDTGTTVSDGSFAMVFSLYTAPTGGSAIWTESTSATVTNGLFSIMLGSTTPLTSVDFNQTLYLGINVEGDGEMSPRKILGTVPAAFEAENAQTLDNIATSSFLRADQADTASGLFTFTNGFVSQASSTITEFNSVNATTTNLHISGALYDNASSPGVDGYILKTTATGVEWVATSTLGFAAASTSHDAVTFAGSYDYLTLSGQEITLGQIDLGTDVTGTLTVANGGTGATSFGANHIPYLNSGNTAFTSSNDFVFDGTFLGIGTSTPNALVSIFNKAGSGTTNLFTVASSTSPDDSTFDTLFSITTEGVSNFGNNAGTGDALLQFGSDSVAWTTGNYSVDKSYRIASSTDLASNVALTILKGGNVGIGTTSPGATLDVAGGLLLSGASTETAYHTGLQRLSGGESVLWYGGGSSGLYFKTGATGAGGDRMALTSAGNLGIGTTSPAYTLDVYGDARIDGDLYDASGSAGVAGYVLQSTASGIEWVATTSLGFAAASTSHAAVTLAGTPNYLTLSGQEITLGLIDLSTDVTDTLTVGNGGTGVTSFGGVGTLLYTTAADTLASSNDLTFDSNGLSVAATSTFSGAVKFSSNWYHNTNGVALVPGTGGPGATPFLYVDQPWFFGSGNTSLGFGSASDEFFANFDSNTNLNNVFIGTSIASSIVDGSDNVVLGAFGFSEVATGSRNVALGAAALSGLVEGNDNIGIGYGAGVSQYSGFVGSNNIFIGNQSGYLGGNNLTAGSDNISIGYDLDFASSTGSGQLTIGNLIFGTGLGATNTAISLGSIGIGTSSPASKLDVWGDLRVGTYSVPTLFANSATGYVGIGNASPDSEIHISTSSLTASPKLQFTVGSITTNSSGATDPGTSGSSGSGATWSSLSNIQSDDTNDAQTSDMNDSGDLTSRTVTVSNFGFSIPVDAAITGIEFNVRGRQNSSAEDVKLENIYINAGGGTVGSAKSDSTDWPDTITTRTYGAEEDVWGATISPADVNASNFGISFNAINDIPASGRMRIQYVSVNVYYSQGGQDWIAGVNGNNSRNFQIAPAANFGTAGLVIDTSGNIGIGTTSPSYTLDVYGDARIDGDLYDASGSAGVAGYVLQSTASGIEWVATSSLNISGGGSSITFGTDNQIPFTNSGGTDYDYSGNFTFNGSLLSVNGTASSTALQVNGNATTTGRMYVGGPNIITGAESGDAIAIQSSDYDGSNGAFIGANANEISVGYDNNLGGVDNQGPIVFGRGNTGTANDEIVFGYNNTVSADGAMVFGSGITNSLFNSLMIGPNDTSKITIRHTGNVGIGTTSPSSVLDVWGDFRVGTSSTPALLVSANNSRVTLSGDLYVGGQFYDADNSAGSAGYVLQATATGTRWVATSSLGISSGTSLTFGTDNQIPFTNAGGDDYEYSGNLTFDGTKLTVTQLSVTDSSATTTLAGSLAIGTNNVFATGANSFAMGQEGSNVADYILASGHGAFAGGYPTVGTTGNSANVTASGHASLAFGSVSSGFGGDAQLLASQSGSFAFGKITSPDAASPASIISSSLGSFAIGYVNGASIISSGNGSFAGGRLTSGTTTASGHGSFAWGQGLTISGLNSVGFGSNFTNNIANTFQVGYESTPTLTVNSTGVGIGTSSPASKLDVWGDFRVGTSSNPTLFVDSATGNVTIGGTDQSHILTLNGANNLATSTAIQFLETPNVGYQMRYDSNSNDFYIEGLENGIVNTAFKFYRPNGSVTLNPSGGYAGVGGTNASSKFFIQPDSGFDALRINADNDNASSKAINIVDENTLASIFSITSLGTVGNYYTYFSGNVGIGTSTPGYKLTVAGDAYITGALRDSSASAGTNGYVLQSTGSGTQWVATSSLGITGGGGSASFGTDNQIPFTNSGGTDFDYASNLTFSGTSLTAPSFNISGSTSTILSVNSSPLLQASSTIGFLSLGFGTTTGTVTVSDSFFVGDSAGNGATSAGRSNFLGYQAGLGAINADRSNFLGYKAGLGTVWAYDSNFLGFRAGEGASNAYESNFLGYYAGHDASDAYQSNFFGYWAGYQATDADNSNFIGFSTGYQATDANNSNFIGTNAGFDATYANNSNFIGEGAGDTSTYASYSNFIGDYAGEWSEYARNSNFIGYYAGYRSTNAATSTFIGYQAGYNADNAANSIFIGTNAGYNDTVDNYSTLGSSIAIGRYAGTGGFSNSIALGRGVINSAAQQLNIGNVLYATDIYNSDATSSAPTSGNVGIGTSSPFSRLTVAGDITPDATLTYDLGSSTRRWDNVWAQTLNIGTSTWSIFNGSNGRLAFSNAAEQGGTEALSILTNGNVGIGSSTPLATFSVQGNDASGSNGENAPLAFLVRGGAGADLDGFQQEAGKGGDVKIFGGNGGVGSGFQTYGGPGGDVYISGGSQGTPFGNLNGDVILAHDGSSALGRVGVGTNNPSFTLEVSGSLGVVGTSNLLRLGYSSSIYHSLIVASDGGLSWNSSGTDADLNFDFSTATDGDFSVNTSQFFVDTSSGNVGIGTTTPLGQLHVASSNSGAASVSSNSDELVLESSGASGLTILGGAANTQRINFGDSGSQTIGAIEYENGNDAFAFRTNSSERLRIDSSGNVGIGTANPGAALEVAGDFYLASGTTRTIGIAQAEYLGYGDDLVIHAGDSNEEFGEYGKGGDLYLYGGTDAWGFYDEGNIILAHTGSAARGNVGIGTSSPSYTLDVYGDARIDGDLYDASGSAGVAGYVLQSTASGIEWVATSSLGISSASFGTDNQIPFTNSGGTDYDYSSNFTFDNTKLTAPVFNASGASTTILLHNNSLLLVGSSTGGLIGLGYDVGTPSGSNNNSSFFGTSAGYGATNASNSNFFGFGAGADASNASFSSFIGTSAGYGAADASSSNFFGLFSGFEADNAANSNFFGSYAGTFSANAANSLFLGNYAGYTDFVDNTSGGTSIAIGQYAGTGGFSNSIALGRGVINSATTQLNIGNVLYATGIYNSDTQTAVPQSGGFVGIGTSSPSYKLDVYGDARIDGLLYDAFGSAGNPGDVLKSTASGIQWVSTSSLNIAADDTVTVFHSTFATTSPGSNVTVQFNGTADSQPSFSGGTLTLPSNTLYYTVEMWGAGGGGGGAGSGSGGQGGGGGGGGAYTTKSLSDTSTQYFTVGSGGAGNTGSGAGTAGGDSCWGTNATACTGPTMSAGGGVGGEAPSGGTLGSGGTAAGGDINQNGGNGGANQGSGGADGAGGGGSAGPYQDGGDGENAASGAGPQGGSGYARGGDGGLESNGNGSNGAGVGAGGGGGASDSGNGGNGITGQLTLTLYVATSSGADLAENYPVKNEDIEAGDIVVFDTNDPIVVDYATKDDSRPLVGIVSTKPGITLDDNAWGEEVRPIALAGRVPAKVNLDGGPIFAGDRIAPSSVPGVGKKAAPFERSVGTAITSYQAPEEGEIHGEVLVFIDLQPGINTDSLTRMLFAGATSTDSNWASSTKLFDLTQDDTIWTRLYKLATNFVDGVLTLVGIKSEYVETDRLQTNELCVDDVCVSADDLRALLESSNEPGANDEQPADIGHDENTDETDDLINNEDETNADNNPENTTGTSTDPVQNATSSNETIFEENPTEVATSTNESEFPSDDELIETEQNDPEPTETSVTAMEDAEPEVVIEDSSEENNSEQEIIDTDEIPATDEVADNTVNSGQ